MVKINLQTISRMSNLIGFIVRRTNFFRQLSVQITETINTNSDFQAYVIASPVYLTFTDGVIYIKTALKMIGEPLSTAVLNFQGVESSSNMLTVIFLREFQFNSS